MSQPLKVYARENKSSDIHCILLHGFGADAHDLMGLASEINTRSSVDYLFPQAPYSIEVQGQKYGTAWFPRTEDEIMRALTGDYFVGISRIDPPALCQSVDEILAFIESSGIEWNRLVIGGFSQGAMIAAELALRAPAPPAGVVLLSGALVAHSRWEGLADELTKRWGGTAAVPDVPLFQSHGIQDPILDVAGAEALHELLTASQFSGELRTFAGGHTIPLPILNELAEFIDSTAGLTTGMHDSNPV